MENKEKGKAVAVRDFFGVDIHEIKEFKTKDPEGYEEIAKLCQEYFKNES